jgi:hypothetical protein
MKAGWASMILNGVERVIAELKVSAEPGGESASDRQRRRNAQMNLDLIALLQSSVGPEKWIDLHGHLQLGVYHGPCFDEGKRAIPQVVIWAPHPSTVTEIEYLLPVESGSWKYVMGYAHDAPAAAAMVIDALGQCEQRAEYLYESYV